MSSSISSGVGSPTKRQNQFNVIVEQRGQRVITVRCQSPLSDPNCVAFRVENFFYEHELGTLTTFEFGRKTDLIKQGSVLGKFHRCIILANDRVGTTGHIDVFSRYGDPLPISVFELRSGN